MIPLILGASTLAGAIVGSVAGFLVHWEVANYLIRHSRYKAHTIGHLIHRRRTL